MLIVHSHKIGATITGDEVLLEKAQKGTGKIDPSLLDNRDVSVNAHSLDIFIKGSLHLLSN